jgi:hypothetical protein
VTTPNDSTDLKYEIVSCPNGKKVVGGGATATPGPYINGPAGTVYLRQSAPQGDSGWLGVAEEVPADATNWRLRVTAICANVG